MQRYLAHWFLATVLMLLAVIAINLFVDPYGIFRLVDQPGFNSLKPAAASHGAMSKAHQVMRVQPKTLILGNSRAEVGLNPNHPAWPQSARPVYNAALPGTGTATSLRYLKHVLAANAGNPSALPTLVVWGVDFMDFLTDPTKPTSAQPTSDDSPESKRLMTAPISTRLAQQARDYAESTLTLGALVDSVITLANQRNPYAIDLTPQGFNPMRDYIKIAQDEGYWAVFRQKDLANIKSFSSRPRSIFDSSGNTSPQLEDLREVMRLCRLHGIELRLFTYPYHAHLLEIFRITGHWPAFDDWRRALVQLVESEAAALGKSPTPIWDFSSFSSVTMEQIPKKGDRKTQSQWYWEAGHFKAELGDQMLNRFFQRDPLDVSFGQLRTSQNLQESTESLKVQRAHYIEKNAREIDEIAAAFRPR